MYTKIDAIAIAGKTKPTSGTKIEGKYEAAIFVFLLNL
jgi:hypothetical protein